MISLLIFFLIGDLSEAKTKKVAVEKEKPAHSIGSATVLWKEWYLLTIQGSAQGYFMEEFERRGAEKQLNISQTWFEKRDGGISTFIGSVATDNERLAPVAFFSDRKSANKNYKIDGRAKGANLVLQLKGENAKGSGAKTYPISKDLYLSNFIPYALTHVLKAGATWNFSAVIEDPIDENFEVRKGKASRSSGTRQFGKEECKKFNLTIDGNEQDWWVAESGKLCEVNLPLLQSKLELTTEENIKKLFP